MIRAVSADSHVLEPADLWLERIDVPFRDRAPRTEQDAAGTSYFVCEGARRAIRVLGTPYAVQDQQAEEVRRGGWDPAERIEDMAIDGIEAEVLYPSLAMSIYGTHDSAFQGACFRAYNDWLAEFCQASPTQLYGVSLIPLYDVEAGIRELRRTVKLGLRGAAVWGTPPDDLSFLSDRYDPFWAEAQALQTPISLHCFTGHNLGLIKNFMAGYAASPHLIQQSLAMLIFAGVFERFPGLMVLSVENDIGWVPYLIQRMDHGQERKGKRRGKSFPSGLSPGERFRHNVRCTFMTDPVGIRNLDLMGPDVPMWSTDYPHDDSTWPLSQQVIESDFSAITGEDKDKVVFSNAANLYNMSV